MINIEVNGVEEIVADLQALPLRSGRALVRSMNRAMVSGRTFVAPLIARDMGLTSTTVRASMSIKNATYDRPVAVLGSTLKRIPLIQFGARGPRPSRGRGRGVSARTPAGRYPHAFIATMASGHEGVFERRGRSRLPIKELFGPSPGHVFAKYRPQTMARIKESFQTNFDHEWSRASGGVSVFSGDDGGAE